MSLQLFAHPFSSYCQKALIALYENGTAFELHMLEDPEVSAKLAAIWPVKRFPVLVDDGRIVLEASIIIEHLDVFHRGPTRRRGTAPPGPTRSKRLCPPGAPPAPACWPAPPSPGPSTRRGRTAAIFRLARPTATEAGQPLSRTGTTALYIVPDPELAKSA